MPTKYVVEKLHLDFSDAAGYHHMFIAFSLFIRCTH